MITARQSIAGLAADPLREQISTLAQQLTALKTELAHLPTTRTTLLRLAGHPDNPPETPSGNPTYQQILVVFATAEHRLRTRTSAKLSAWAPPPTAPKACAPNSSAWSPAACSPKDQAGLFAPARPRPGPPAEGYDPP